MPGPTRTRDVQALAGNLLRLARLRRGWSQRQLAEQAGVPASTVARIESGARQPSLVTLDRLLAAADLELRTRIEPYDDHDDVLDARQAALTDTQRQARAAADASTARKLAAGYQHHLRSQTLGLATGGTTATTAPALGQATDPAAGTAVGGRRAP